MEKLGKMVKFVQDNPIGSAIVGALIVAAVAFGLIPKEWLVGLLG